MPPLHLTIITPDKVVLNEDVDYVYLPGSDGEMGILDQHTPLIGVTRPGEMRYKRTEGHKEHTLVIGLGFVQVAENHVELVVDLALKDREINEETFEQAIENAKKALEDAQQLSAEESARFEATIAKNLAVLNFKRARRNL